MELLVEEITALLHAPARHGESAEVVARMEWTLTDGYAHALALEAEHERLSRQIQRAAAAAQAPGRDSASELAALAARLTRAEADLFRLRGLLAELRTRTRELRG